MLPFYHIYGMNVVMNWHIREGVTVVTVPNFKLEPFLETLEEHSVTVAYLVPPIVLRLAQEPLVEEYDLSALSLIGSGAAPLPEEVATACASRLDCLVKQGYGLTEASPTTYFTPRDPDRVRRGTGRRRRGCCAQTRQGDRRDTEGVRSAGWRHRHGCSQIICRRARGPTEKYER